MGQGRRRLLPWLIVVILGLSACRATHEAAGPIATATPEASVSPRPLNLPPVASGEPCPVSPMKQFPAPPGHKLPGYGFGLGPFYLSGQIEWYTGVSSLLLVSSSYTGPVVIRGRQLDGSNGIPFQDQQGQGDITIGPTGVSDWREWGAILSGPPGCYALQADGTSFTEVIVFR